MKGQTTIVIIMAGLLLLAAGFAAGMAWTAHRLEGTGQVGVASVAAPLADNVTPTIEVPGADVAGLPRFPGSNRVEYRQVLDGDYRETEVEYVVPGDVRVVHDFYRDVFDEEGWQVADLGVYQGEWTFFVIKDGREALLEIESRGELIEIEIEIDEPLEMLGTLNAGD